MTYYRDLSEYSYHDGMFYRPGTLNVGWLGREHEFSQAEPADEVLRALWEFCKISVAQMRGIHECEFCSESSHLAQRNGETLLLGSSEIRVFSRGAEVYAAPTLIYHYIAVHHYSPPEAFVRALKEGPSPGGPEYFARLKALGLQWGKTAASAGKPFRFTRE